MTTRNLPASKAASTDLLKWVLTAPERAIDFFASLPQSVRSAEEAVRLSQMSDEELAKRGLTRDQIVEVAFRDQRVH